MIIHAKNKQSITEWNNEDKMQFFGKDLKKYMYG